jgi:hypothetical protein
MGRCHATRRRCHDTRRLPRREHALPVLVGRENLQRVPHRDIVGIVGRRGRVPAELCVQEDAVLLEHPCAVHVHDVGVVDGGGRSGLGQQAHGVARR